MATVTLKIEPFVSQDFPAGTPAPGSKFMIQNSDASFAVSKAVDAGVDNASFDNVGPGDYTAVVFGIDSGGNQVSPTFSASFNVPAETVSFPVPGGLTVLLGAPVPGGITAAVG